MAWKEFKAITYQFEEQVFDVERSEELSLSIYYDFAWGSSGNRLKGLHNLLNTKRGQQQNKITYLGVDVSHTSSLARVESSVHFGVSKVVLADKHGAVSSAHLGLSSFGDLLDGLFLKSFIQKFVNKVMKYLPSALGIFCFLLNSKKLLWGGPKVDTSCTHWV